MDDTCDIVVAWAMSSGGRASGDRRRGSGVLEEPESGRGTPAFTHALIPEIGCLEQSHQPRQSAFGVRPRESPNLEHRLLTACDLSDTRANFVRRNGKRNSQASVIRHCLGIPPLPRKRNPVFPAITKSKPLDHCLQAMATTITNPLHNLH